MFSCYIGLICIIVVLGQYGNYFHLLFPKLNYLLPEDIWKEPINSHFILILFRFEVYRSTCLYNLTLSHNIFCLIPVSSDPLSVHIYTKEVMFKYNVLIKQPSRFSKSLHLILVSSHQQDFTLVDQTLYNKT